MTSPPSHCFIVCMEHSPENYYEVRVPLKVFLSKEKAAEYARKINTEILAEERRLSKIWYDLAFLNPAHKGRTYAQTEESDPAVKEAYQKLQEYREKKIDPRIFARYDGRSGMAVIIEEEFENGA